MAGIGTYSTALSGALESIGTTLQAGGDIFEVVTDIERSPELLTEIRALDLDDPARQLLNSLASDIIAVDRNVIEGFLALIRGSSSAFEEAADAELVLPAATQTATLHGEVEAFTESFTFQQNALTILEKLSEQTNPRTTKQLAQIADINYQTVLYALGILEKAGLVELMGKEAIPERERVHAYKYFVISEKGVAYLRSKLNHSTDDPRAFWYITYSQDRMLEVLSNGGEIRAKELSKKLGTTNANGVAKVLCKIGLVSSEMRSVMAEGGKPHQVKYYKLTYLGEQHVRRGEFVDKERPSHSVLLVLQVLAEAGEDGELGVYDISKGLKGIKGPTKTIPNMDSLLRAEYVTFRMAEGDEAETVRSSQKKTKIFKLTDAGKAAYEEFKGYGRLVAEVNPETKSRVANLTRFEAKMLGFVAVKDERTGPKLGTDSIKVGVDLMERLLAFVSVRSRGGDKMAQDLLQALAVGDSDLAALATSYMGLLTMFAGSQPPKKADR